MALFTLFSLYNLSRSGEGCYICDLVSITAVPIYSMLTNLVNIEGWREVRNVLRGTLLLGPIGLYTYQLLRHMKSARVVRLKKSRLWSYNLRQTGSTGQMMGRRFFEGSRCFWETRGAFGHGAISSPAALNTLASVIFAGFSDRRYPPAFPRKLSANPCFFMRSKIRAT